MSFILTSKNTYIVLGSIFLAIYSVETIAKLSISLKEAMIRDTCALGLSQQISEEESLKRLGIEAKGSFSLQNFCKAYTSY